MRFSSAVESLNKRLPAPILSFLKTFRTLFVEIYRDRVFGRAAEMAYLSLLALVPVVAVVLSLSAHIWTDPGIIETVQQRLLKLFIPSTASVVIGYIDRFAQNAITVRWIGFFFFLVVAASLFNGIEATFNDIWGLSQKRRWYIKLTAFLLFFTVAPFFLGVSFYITVTVRDLVILKEILGRGWVQDVLRVAIPYGLTFLGFSFAYLVMPHMKVRMKAAIIGGGVAAVLWEVAKEGFDYYINNVVRYDHLYGALGVIPIFLIWLYVTWVIVLLGAELSFVIQHSLPPKQS